MTEEGLHILRSREAECEGLLAAVTRRLEVHCEAMHQHIDNLPSTPETRDAWHNLHGQTWDQRFEFIELLVDQVRFNQTKLAEAIRILERELPEGEAKSRLVNRLAADERQIRHANVSALLLSVSGVSD